MVYFFILRWVVPRLAGIGGFCRGRRRCGPQCLPLLRESFEVAGSFFQGTVSMRLVSAESTIVSVVPVPLLSPSFVPHQIYFKSK